MTEPAPRRRNHLVWIGVLVSIFGLISYFAIFATIPSLRDTAWLNLLLVGLGLALSVVALIRRRSVLSVVGFVASTACVALLAGYVFVLSEQLPDTSGVVAVGAQAPNFELLDHTETTVRLADFAGRPLVIVFYRGFW